MVIINLGKSLNRTIQPPEAIHLFKKVIIIPSADFQIAQKAFFSQKFKKYSPLCPPICIYNYVMRKFFTTISRFNVENLNTLRLYEQTKIQMIFSKSNADLTRDNDVCSINFP